MSSLPINQIINGDSLEVLKTFPDESVDLVCTDPPYGYSFMGKNWDKAVPPVEVWKECLRVLKPGAFAFIMSAPRSDVLSRMIVRIEDAGFRVDFTPIYWTYSSGFPKAMNIGKMVDKRNGVERKIIGSYSGAVQNKNSVGGGYNASPNADKNGRTTVLVSEATSEEAKALDGSYGGFQPKPAVEVVIVAMKPLSKKTFVDQALKNGKGITWLDDGRIPSTELTPRNNGGKYVYNLGMQNKPTHIEPHQNGRFPANLLVEDDVLNDGSVAKPKLARSGEKGGSGFGYFDDEKTAKTRGFWPQDAGGSYSRYFDLDAWAKTLPFLIVPKASKSEKNEGLEAFEQKTIKSSLNTKNGSGERLDGAPSSRPANFHPTVKPLKLMSYLITLGSREGDMVLDPFLGSGTTALAAKQLNRNYIGIEREKEYVEIAQGRINSIPQTLF